MRFISSRTNSPAAVVAEHLTRDLMWGALQPRVPTVTASWLVETLPSASSAQHEFVLGQPLTVFPCASSSGKTFSERSAPALQSLVFRFARANGGMVSSVNGVETITFLLGGW
jgi:hypothetical protein